MVIFHPKYKDKKTGELKESRLYWYEFWYAGRRVSERAKTASKTLARAAEKQRRRELEQGFNGPTDNRQERMVG